LRPLRAILIQAPSPKTSNSPHLGLGYLGAILKAKEVEVKIIDATAPYARYDNMEEIFKEVKLFKPDLIGITITTLFSVFSYDLIRLLSKLDCIIPLSALPRFDFGFSVSSLL